MSKPVILTGLRANNDLHIGNYLGALLPMVDMAKQKAGKYQVNLFVPDLHSFTTPIDHDTLQKATMNNLRVYAAAGLPLDNADVHIYRQSYIPAHSELTWILDCFAHFGELRRMIQFKEKTQTTDEERHKYKNMILDSLLNKYAKDNKYKNLTLEQFRKVIDDALEEVEKQLNKLKLQNASIGLFSYPVLMAADILLYDATYVPVGDDQTQHLEFTRDIAGRVNRRFGDIFTVPKPASEQHKFFGKDQGLRVKDLVDPSKKMSKSDESGKGVIFLTDTPDAAYKKVMGATTDSVGEVHYDVEKQPGISNLLQLHALLGDETLDAVIEHHEGDRSYGDLKKEVAEQVSNFLKDFQQRVAAVDDKKLLAKLESDEKLMNAQANRTLLKVQKAVGLR